MTGRQNMPVSHLPPLQGYERDTPEEQQKKCITHNGFHLVTLQLHKAATERQ
jgi:hypothetical protein